MIVDNGAIFVDTNAMAENDFALDDPDGPMGFDAGGPDLNGMDMGGPNETGPFP